MKNSDDLGRFDTLIGASASSSDIATVPQTQATAGDGTASIAAGFPPETFISRDAGGSPPRGQDMNGFLNRISKAIQVLQAGFPGQFDSNFASGIGGYPMGAMIPGSAIGTFWVSTADNNTTTPGASGASWQSLFAGSVSGTLGVVSTNNDQNGTGLHLNGSTSRASFIYASGSGDLAWYSDIASEASARATADTSLSSAISAETTRAKAAEATAVSGTLGVIEANKDEVVTGLHINGATGRPSVVHTSGSADIAWESDVTSEASTRASADTALSNAITSEASARATADTSLSSAISAETTRAKAAEATAVSGTLGVIEANKDEAVTGLHINGATGRPSVVRTSGSADVAWESDVTSEASTRASADTALSNAITSEASARATADASLSSAISAETTRAKAAEATAVSGTLGVIAANKDEQGTGLHLDGATGNASFTSSSGSFDLASYATATTMPTLYTSSTTLTVGSGKSIAVIQAVGGGGSGCSVKGTSIANSTYGAGGAAGGYVNFHIAVSSGDTIGITVGAGASSPVNTINGQTNGGDTIVTLNGTEVARASGGTGGVWNSVASCAGGTGGGASTQNGATPITYSNGTDGGDGQTGAESISSVTGYGGAGVWGGGGRAGNGGGNSGTGFGAGGGGAYDTSYSDTFYGGGAGHDGCAIVEIK